jgi:hypothetical protein
MTSDNVKAVLYAVAGTVALVAVWKVVATANQIGNNISGAGAAVDQMMENAMANLRKNIAEVGNSIANSIPSANDVTRSIRESMGLSNPNPDFVAPDYVTLLPLAQWSDSVKAFIRDSLRVRKLKVSNTATDFVGWKVYSDGTVISPYGEYFSMTATGPGLYTASERYSSSGTFPSFDTAVSFPTGAQLTTALQDNIDAGIFGGSF